MSELVLVQGLGPDCASSPAPGPVPSPAPSNPKNLADQRTEIPVVSAPSRRKAYIPPRVENLGSVESITFHTSIILG
jgi:hypothetical protein